MKKFLVCLMLLITAAMLTCALAEDKPTVHTSGDYKYVLLEDGTAKITQYTGKAAQLTIPTTLDGYSVTSIGDWAFPPLQIFDQYHHPRQRHNHRHKSVC